MNEPKVLKFKTHQEFLQSDQYKDLQQALKERPETVKITVDPKLEKELLDLASSKD